MASLWLQPAEARESVLLAARSSGDPMRIEAAYRADRIHVRVVDPQGRETQRFTVQTDVENALPSLADADGDGASDLWFPTMTGNANTIYEVWRMQPSTGRFLRAGEVSGVDFRRDGGFLVAHGRNGCCAVGYAFYRFGARGAMIEAFVIDRHFPIPADGDDSGREAACGTSSERQLAPASIVRRYCDRAPDGPVPGQRIRFY